MRTPAKVDFSSKYVECGICDRFDQDFSGESDMTQACVIEGGGPTEGGWGGDQDKGKTLRKSMKGNEGDR